MPRLKFTNFTDFLVASLCILAAIALQIQITLFQSPTYLGLRINLADFLVIPVGIAILATLLRRQSLWPAWQLKHTYLWLLALTGILTFALLNTYFTYGELSRWALLNKFGGWFILIALMGMGAWIATNASRERIELFLKTFLYFSLGVLTYKLGCMLMQAYPWGDAMFGHNPYAMFPIEGFMANRNAYGLLFLTTLSLCTCLYFSSTPLLKPVFFYGLYFLLPFFLVLNGSRAVILTTGILLPILFLAHHKQWRQARALVLAVIIGIIAFAAIFHDKPDKLVILKDNHLEIVSVVQEGPQTLEYPGDPIRLSIIADAKEMIAMNPAIGSGLGSMLLYQEQKHGKMINLIDCTALWIHVEMGLIGLVLFAGFYIQSARTLCAAYKTDEDLSKAFRKSLFFILIAFTIMSLFHEIMYTRFIWFFLGLGLALPSRMRQSV